MFTSKCVELSSAAVLAAVWKDEVGGVMQAFIDED